MNPVVRKGGQCPLCPDGRLVPIVYGTPDPEQNQLYKEGKVILGGPVQNEVFDEQRIQFVILDPPLGCPVCKKTFFRDGRLGQ